MVELRMRNREMRADGTQHHEKLGINRSLCATKLTIPVTAATRPDPACNSRDMLSSQPNQSSHTPDFSYLLVSRTLFSSSSPVSCILIHHSIMIAEHKDMSSLPMSPCDVHEWTPSTAYKEYSIYWVQHTLSTAYAEYSIHLSLSVFPSFSWLRVNHWM